MILSQPDFFIQPASIAICNDSLFLCFHKGQVLLTKELDIPSFGQLASLLPEGCSPFELAHTDAFAIFTLPPFSDIAVPETDGFSYREIGVLRTLPYEKGALLAACWHLWSWYSANRFCGQCGGLNKPAQAERALCCTSCGRMHFPMIAPAVIVAVTCGDKILLAKNARSTYKHYGLIAGYVEVGETLEHATEREVKEETGLDISHLRYLGNQPWGISGSHMFAFHATASTDQPIRIQESELSEARWFDRSELPPRGNAISIAGELIDRFRHGML